MANSPGHPFFFPDCNDATPNKPNTFVDADQIIALYNQENAGTPVKNFAQRAVDWFCDYEKGQGWDDAQPVTGTIKGVLLQNNAVAKCKK
jgi:hypothetical protein